MSHSPGNREVEIKLILQSLPVARRLLRVNGFRISKSRIFEDNLVLDTPRHALHRQGKLLRLRQAGREGTLTFKGRPVPGKHKDREELELAGIDAALAYAIITRLGFQTAFRYQKYRTEFQKPGNRGVVTLDETPIGNFLELEGSPAWIDRTARLLGFAETDYVLGTYSQLYRSWCRQEKVRPGHMVFPGRETTALPAK